jgi:hypothetical protein
MVRRCRPAPADLARHVLGTAVTLPEGQGGQAVSCQWLLRSHRQLAQPLGKSAVAAQDSMYAPVKGQGMKAGRLTRLASVLPDVLPRLANRTEPSKGD